MENIIIHAGDDVNVVIPLASIDASLTHDDYLDVRADLVDRRNNILARFSKEDNGSTYHQWIVESDTVDEEDNPVYRVVIPIDDSITLPLQKGPYFLNVGFEFADVALPDLKRFQSDTVLEITVVGAKEPTSNYSDIVVNIGISGSGGGNDENAIHLDTANEISTLTAKTTPVDADITIIEDSADSGNKKKVTWASIKATLKTYFDNIYATINSVFNVLQLNSLYAPTGLEPIYSMYADPDNHTVTVVLENGVRHQLGLEELTFGTDEGNDFFEGAAVSIKGVTGNRVAFELTDFSSTSTNYKFFIGLLTSAPDSGNRMVCRGGEINDIPTLGNLSYGGLETWAENNALWGDPLHPGYMTNIEPSAGANKVFMGRITIGHLTSGQIALFPRVYCRLEDLSNVSDTSSDGTTLIKRNGIWTFENIWAVLTEDTTILWTNVKDVAAIQAEIDALPKNLGGYELVIQIQDISRNIDADLEIRGIHNGKLRFESLTNLEDVGTTQNSTLVFTGMYQVKLLNSNKLILDISSIKFNFVADQQTILFNIDGDCIVVSHFNYYDALGVSEAAWAFFLANGARLASSKDTFRGSISYDTSIADLTRGDDVSSGVHLTVTESEYVNTPFTNAAYGKGTCAFISTNTGFTNKTANSAVDLSGAASSADLSALTSIVVSYDDTTIDVDCEAQREGIIWARVYAAASLPSNTTELYSGTGEVDSDSEPTNGFEAEALQIASLTPEAEYVLYLYLETSLGYRYEYKVYEITMEATPDVIPPAEGAFDPANAESNVAIDSNITITFGEVVYLADGSAINNTNVDSLITLKEDNGSGADIAFDATVDTGSGYTVITVDPTSDLPNSQAVYVAVSPVEDAAGNENTGGNATFTTVADTNMLSNGALADATDWNVQGSGSIIGGQFVATGYAFIAQSQANMNSPLQANTNYRFTFDVTAYSSTNDMYLTTEDDTFMATRSITGTGTDLYVDFTSPANISTGGFRISVLVATSLDNVRLEAL